jgi:phage baseplate assembly protein W
MYSGISTIEFATGVEYSSVTNDVTHVSGAAVVNNGIPTKTGSNTLKLTNVALVERNIINHILTKKRTRLKMPDFGTKISKLIFEPLNDTNINLIKSEIVNCITYDPRVTLIDIKLMPDYDNHSITCNLILYYIEFDTKRNTAFTINKLI